MKTKKFIAILAGVLFLSITACTDTSKADQELYEEGVDKTQIKRP